MADASNHLAHLTSTIDSLGQGLDHAKTGAVRSLHSWGAALSASDEPALKTIADELKQLEVILGEGDINGPKLKKALQSLGKHTTAAAKSAEGATADKVQQLGKLLTDAAGQLS
ncbi:hypothetical protein FNT36_00085 [Hymenobacter setariae]|uniref:Uncharacterized protein n=1 Tax=Hymenobacter setariae TaxID=2594794 RepID=A0A558C192_9BACT|nr:hypothetical protein [Hymenobacter setariae]TVT42539.1 hypothetical protein FNT36_00085 [Hymenobacter setariae]